ncbi:MAG: anaerobic ribonucleoside-triphosphate reductase activating protein [Candidatus Scatovivens sp.]
MNYADIKEVDIQDGEGVRVSLYVSGCHFHCKGCHNKEAWDFNYGNEFTDETIERIIKLLDKNYITGLSILGGEPLEPINQKGLVKLVKEVKQKFPSKTIWCWTGYDFEKDIFGKMYKQFPFTKELLKNIDIIVDGQFEEENKLVNLKFRGSTNQKKIDVQASIKNDSIVRLKFGDEDRYTTKKPKIIPIQEYKEKHNNSETEEYRINTQNNGIISIDGNREEKIEVHAVSEKISADSIKNI